MNWAEHSVEIEGSTEDCFDAIVDYETFPQWQNAVERVEVLERDRKGLGELVRLFVNAKGRKVDYTLRYRYDRPTLIEWDFVEGNGVKDVDGQYTFKDLGGGRTLATYRLGVDPGLPIPGAIARRIHKQTLVRSVDDLKEEAERRGNARLGSRTAPEGATGATGGNGGGHGPLDLLGLPLGIAKKTAERSLDVAGSVAGGVADRVGGVLGRLRGRD
jgi:hypothetical protein